VAEGLTLCFIGLLLMILYPDVRKGERVARKVGIFLALVLFVFAGWTALTGARTSIVPIKICPFVKMVCGLLVLGPLWFYRKEWADLGD